MINSISSSIHPCAIISPDAQIAPNVRIDPYAVIEDGVSIDEGTHVMSHATICHGSRIGKDCKIHQFAVVGGIPQDLKFKGEETELIIGDRTTIREYVTLSRGTASRGYTKIGNECLIMAYSHIAHDCVIGNRVIVGNATQVAGEVIIDDFATISAAILIHQFVRVGAYSMMQGGAKTSKDIPPYSLVGRDPICFCGINSVGLERNHFSPDAIHLIDDIYRTIYYSGLNTSNAIAEIKEKFPTCTERDTIINFVESSERGILRKI